MSHEFVSPVYVVAALALTAAGVQAQSSESHIDFSRAPSAFPDVLNPYKPNPIPPFDLENSPRLHDLLCRAARCSSPLHKRSP